MASMLDVLIVGAGPAGAVAATVLARAGARVRIVDRAAFPRDKLCGDTVNPGTLASLGRLRLARTIDSCGLPVEGMCVTGANGAARVPGGLTNVCLVQPWRAGDPPFGNPREMLLGELARDPLLRDRFAGARVVGPPVVLGPLAVDVSHEAIDGLLLAGDAAGFVDPMTGDGLCLAIRGAELAAEAALTALEHGWRGVHDGL